MSMGGKKHGGLGGLFGKESSASLNVDLNITPLMDVMSNILFFLLAAFGATVVAQVPTTVPVRSTDASPADTPPEEKVNVSLRADGTGFVLKAESPSIDPALLAGFSAKLGKKDGAFDYEGLTLALKRIKEKYPASKSLVLVPDEDVKYQVIVEIMDAARDYKVATGHRIELFSEVVLSGIVK